MTENPRLFAEVIVPLAVEGCFTYMIPADLESRIAPGMRVEIEFGNLPLELVDVGVLDFLAHADETTGILTGRAL
mgnify:CR=1 FL=1